MATGRKTLFGAVASVLAEDGAPSPFQRDLRGLGLVVARAAGGLSVAVLAVNLLFGRPLVQSLMFAVALAVGLTPELLPMITTVTLSRGAVRMARRRVIVKRLASIHDLGAMTVLCTDKTGTLTSAEIVLAGPELEMLNDDVLAARVQGVDLYGRLTPDQKVRVVRALQARGETVGFLGDGVNDAPGIRTADVGLSVDGATGVARAAADMILLASDLNVVADGVGEGRRTFANILKYVRMGSSSNFGNMLSMAMASLFLPFLPLLATQILLNNLLYDLSEIGIPFDTVDPSDLGRPQRWSMRGIVRYAGIMGPLSSIFDGMTFVVLLYGFHVGAPEFRTAWFEESIATQILVVFLIRTRGVPWRTPPDRWLLVSALCALVVALVLPLTPAGRWFGFVVPGAAVLLAMGAITAGYLVAAQWMKRMAAGRN